MFHLLLGFAENPIVLCDFKIWNSIRITEGSNNGDLDNWDPTVPIRLSSTISHATSAIWASKINYCIDQNLSKDMCFGI